MNKQDGSGMNDVQSSKTFKATKTIQAANWIYVAAETTGLRGGDSGHGGRTIIELGDYLCTDVKFKVSRDQKELRIELGGDSELLTIIEAFEFIVATLKQGIEENR
jgi:hypothetical protein